MTNRYRPGIRRNTASTPIYIYCGQSIHDEDALPVICFILASVMSHPEYLFNYFCPVNLSFLILKYYRTVVIQKSKMAPTVFIGLSEPSVNG